MPLSASGFSNHEAWGRLNTDPTVQMRHSPTDGTATTKRPMVDYATALRRHPVAVHAGV